MKTWIVVILFIISGFFTVRAQETAEPVIQKRLDLIKLGKIEQVRSELPSLLEHYPNNPGILYLQGVLISDGGEAVRTFQNLIDNFPKSEWADDALYRIYQYYYALGLYKTADQKLEKLRQDYPQSPYLRSFQQQARLNLDINQDAGIPEARKQTGGQVQTKPGLTDETTQQKAQVQSPAKQPEVKQQPVVTERVPAVIKEEPAPAITEKKETVRKISPSSSGGYTVQTGVFSSRQNAERYQSDLGRANITAEVRLRQVGGKEMYAVCVGTYTTYEEAQRYVEALREKNITGIVIGR
ncbi:MAG: SPOR domain-containing protein [Bacteroidota bacterium]